MPIDFPSAPATGDLYTYASKEWVWRNSRWNISTRGSVGTTGPSGSDLTLIGGFSVGCGATSSRFIRPPYGIGGGRTLSTGASCFFPMWIENTTVVDQLAVRTSGATGTTGTMVLGLYNDHATAPGRPGTLRLEAGSIDFSAANTTYAVTIDHTLSRGLYWLAGYVRNGGSGTTWNGFTAYVNTWWNGRVFGDLGFVSGAICPVVFSNPLTTTFGSNPSVGYFGYDSFAIYMRIK